MYIYLTIFQPKFGSSILKINKMFGGFQRMFDHTSAGMLKLFQQICLIDKKNGLNLFRKLNFQIVVQIYRQTVTRHGYCHVSIAEESTRPAVMTAQLALEFGPAMYQAYICTLKYQSGVAIWPVRIG